MSVPLIWGCVKMHALRPFYRLLTRLENLEGQRVAQERRLYAWRVMNAGKERKMGFKIRCEGTHKTKTERRVSKEWQSI